MREELKKTRAEAQAPIPLKGEVIPLKIDRPERAAAVQAARDAEAGELRALRRRAVAAEASAKRARVGDEIFGDIGAYVGRDFLNRPKSASESAGGGAGGLKGLKGMFGEESTLGQFGKIARGAGAVAGVTLAAKLIGDAANKMAELNAQFSAGEINAKDLAGDIGRSLPVLGEMTGMFDGIRNLITGEAAELAKLNKENALTNTLLATREKFIKRAAEMQIEFTERIRKAQQSVQGIGLEGTAAQKFGIFAGAADRSAAIRGDAQKRISDLQNGEEYKAASAALTSGSSTEMQRKNAADILKRRDAEIAAIRKQANAELSLSDQQAEKERQAMLRDLQRGELSAQRAHEIELQKMQADAQAQRQNMDGQFLASKLTSIRAAAKAEIDTMRQSLDEQLQTMEANDPRREAMEKRFQEKKAAIIRAGGLQTIEAEKEEAQRRAEAAQSGVEAIRASAMESVSKEIDRIRQSSPGGPAGIQGPSRLQAGVVGQRGKDQSAEILKLMQKQQELANKKADDLAKVVIAFLTKQMGASGSGLQVLSGR